MFVMGSDKYYYLDYTKTNEHNVYGKQISRNCILTTNLLKASSTANFKAANNSNNQTKIKMLMFVRFSVSHGNRYIPLNNSLFRNDKQRLKKMSSRQNL